MSEVDKKRAFNKLKHELEPLRYLIVQVDSVLTWEKNFYPAMVCVAITALYLLLWLLDLTTITLLALSALVVVGFDVVYPMISRFLNNEQNWSSTDETRFEEVCTQLCTIKMGLSNWYEYLFAAKERKSTLVVVLISSVLLTLAWLGAIMNNLLLMYVVTLSLALYPGIHKRCLFGTVKEQFGSVVNDKIKQIREKST